MRKDKLNSFCLQQVLDQEILLDEAGGCEILACLAGSGWRKQRMVWGIFSLHRRGTIECRCTTGLSDRAGKVCEKVSLWLKR